MVWAANIDASSTCEEGEDCSKSDETINDATTKENVRLESPISEPCGDDHAPWRAWVPIKGVTIKLIIAVFMYMSTLFCVLEWKLSQAEALLERQKERLLKLIEMVNTLKERNKENERRVEMQKHELKEQETRVRELWIALQMKSSSSSLPPHSILLKSSIVKETPHFWLFRRHKENLARITKSRIKEIIKASVEAGIVPELVVGECAETSTNAEQSCSMFYKALQMRISESPHSFAAFLQILRDKLKGSEPLCSKILAELSTI